MPLSWIMEINKKLARVKNLPCAAENNAFFKPDKSKAQREKLEPY